MLNGVFKDRSAKERLASEEQALVELLASRELRGYALVRQCEIGPFVVDYLFPTQCLIVELETNRESRRKFLNAMGYDVLAISPQELARHPDRVLAKLRIALSRS